MEESHSAVERRHSCKSHVIKFGSQVEGPYNVKLWGSTEEKSSQGLEDIARQCKKTQEERT